MGLANFSTKTEEGMKETGETVKCKGRGSSITSLIGWPTKESGTKISSQEEVHFLISFPKFCLAFSITTTSTKLNNSG